MGGLGVITIKTVFLYFDWLCFLWPSTKAHIFFSFLLLVNRLGIILHQKGHGHSHGFNPQKKSTNKTPQASPTSFVIVEEEENVNVRAAFIHVLGDFLQSIGVFIAALLIWFKVSFVLFRGGGTPLCGLYRYVRPQRFFSRLGHKLGIDFTHFASILVINRVRVLGAGRTPLFNFSRSTLRGFVGKNTPTLCIFSLFI